MLTGLNEAYANNKSRLQIDSFAHRDSPSQKVGIRPLIHAVLKGLGRRHSMVRKDPPLALTPLTTYNKRIEKGLRIRHRHSGISDPPGQWVDPFLKPRLNTR